MPFKKCLLCSEMGCFTIEGYLLSKIELHKHLSRSWATIRFQKLLDIYSEKAIIDP
jgi:hypothetical protein